MVTKVLYVDLLNLFYQALSAVKSADQNGEPNGGFIGTVASLRKLVERFRPQKVVVVFDGPNAGYRRKKLHPEYKEKRGRKTRSIAFELSSGEEIIISNEDQQMRDVYNFLKLLPLDIIMVPYYEADDIIAYLALNNPDYHHIISSSDKDYLQLVRDNISVWSPSKKILFTPQTMQEYYGILPSNYIYFRSIVGDSSDTLKGVKGISEKTMTKEFPQLQTELFEDFWGFWNMIETSEGKGKKLDKLKSSRDEANLMYRLMKLSTDDISADAIAQVHAQLKSTVYSSRMHFKVSCMQKGWDNKIKDLGNYAQSFPYFTAEKVKLN